MNSHDNKSPCITRALSGRRERRGHRRSVKAICLSGGIAAMAAATLLAHAPQAVAQKVPTIRVGWTIPAEDSKYLLKQRPDRFPNLGTRYNIQWVQFQGTAPMIQAMIAGALDCSTQGALSLANGYLEAGLRTYVVAQHLGTGSGSFAPYWAVLEKSDIRKGADLKGKTVGINVIGSGLYGPLALYLKQAGLDPRRDIRLVETGFAGAEDALRAGRVDAVILNQPFAARAEATGGIRTLFNINEVIPTTVEIVEACSKAFVDATPELAELYVRDLTMAMDMAIADRDETIKVASEVTTAPVGVLNTFYLITGRDFRRTSGAEPEFDVIQSVFNLYHEAGMIRSTIDATVFRHPSIVAPLK